MNTTLNNVTDLEEKEYRLLESRNFIEDNEEILVLDKNQYREPDTSYAQGNELFESIIATTFGILQQRVKKKFEPLFLEQLVMMKHKFVLFIKFHYHDSKKENNACKDDEVSQILVKKDCFDIEPLNQKTTQRVTDLLDVCGFDMKIYFEFIVYLRDVEGKQKAYKFKAMSNAFANIPVLGKKLCVNSVQISRWSLNLYNCDISFIDQQDIDTRQYFPSRNFLKDY